MRTNESADRSGAYPLYPRVAVGAVVFRNGKVLLVKRNKSPARGQWAIPGGSVNLGESLGTAAEREVHEETGIVIEAGECFYTFDIIEKDDSDNVRFHYVIVDLKAIYLSGKPRGGDDAISARWIGPEELGQLDVSSSTIAVLEKYFGFGPKGKQADNQGKNRHGK